MPTSGLIRYTRLRRPASPSARFAADWAINPSFHLGGGAGAKSTPQTGLRHISNRSRTCRNGNWKMASGDWRRKATGFRAESPEFAGQRLGRASITRRNVGSTCTAGNRIGETALAGWLAGVGGFELSDPEKPPLEHGLTATEGSSCLASCRPRRPFRRPSLCVAPLVKVHEIINFALSGQDHVDRRRADRGD
jgi:hypothetical protein